MIGKRSHKHIMKIWGMMMGERVRNKCSTIIDEIDGVDLQLSALDTISAQCSAASAKGEREIG